MKSWAFVPARGGSKSIPLKNLVRLAGLPLIDYGVRAAQSSACFERIICSTDHPKIAEHALELGVQVDERPPRLCTDDACVDDVVHEFLVREKERTDLADCIVLVQPTSPFLRPSDIGCLLNVLSQDAHAQTAHNITPVSHNSHAWNQRSTDRNGRVTFLFTAERNQARQKQQKPTLSIFGNLIAARTSTLLSGAGFYAEPCATVEIEKPYAVDVDDAFDLVLADAMLRSATVVLPHLSDRAITQAIQ